MYFYVRTQKNNYDIDVIIDVTSDSEFVANTDFEWTRISKLTEAPPIGAYYHDGKVITLESDDYGIIEGIIFEKENQYKEENGISTEVPELPTTSDEDIPEIVEEIEEEPVSPEPGDPRDLPRPMARPIEGVPSTMENYTWWNDNLTDMIALIAAIEDREKVEDRIVYLKNPPAFVKRSDDFEPPTTTQLPFPEDTVEEYLEHLNKQKGYMQDLVNRMKIDLMIPDEVSTQD